MMEEFTTKIRTEKTGTKVTFKPDPEIFSSTEYSFEILSTRLRELALLNSGLKIVLIDERGEGKKETYGIAKYK